MCNHASEKCDKGRPDCWPIDRFYDDEESSEGPPDLRTFAPEVPRHMRAYSGKPRVNDEVSKD